MESLAYSQNPHSLEDAERIFATLKSGHYGKWKATKSSGGIVSESLDHIPKDHLSRMKPPERCTQFTVRAAIRAANHHGDIRTAITGLIRPFRLSTELWAGYTIPLRVEGRSFTIHIDLPNGSNAGVIILRCDMRATQEEKLAFCALVGLETSLCDGEGIQLDLDGNCHVRIVEAPENTSGTYLLFEDFPAAVDLLVANLIASPLCDGLFSIVLDVSAGYFDEPEELDRSKIDGIYREIADGAGFHEFDISTNRIAVQNTWEDRERARLSSADGLGYTESLGSITDSSKAVIGVSLRYDESGYSYLFTGLEKVTDESSPLMSIFDDIKLTA